MSELAYHQLVFFGNCRLIASTVAQVRQLAPFLTACAAIGYAMQKGRLPVKTC
jgi:hypothetical protein